VALLVACSDYGINERKPEVDATDTSDRWGPDTGSGIDSPECLDSPTLIEGVNADESCVAVPEIGTLDSVIEWEISDFVNFREYGHVLMVPAVGPVIDGDGDGDIDDTDPPNVVVISDDGGADANNSHGVLRVLDGRDGTPITYVSRVDVGTTQVYPYRYSNVALGDLDGDGAPEIVAVTTVVMGPPDNPDTGGSGIDTGPPGGDTGSPPGDDTGIVVMPDRPAERWFRWMWGSAAPPPPPPPPGPPPCRVAAFTASGEVAWLAEETPIACGGHAPAIADLEGDGEVEVIVGALVLEGATGAKRSAGEGGTGRPDGFGEAGWMSFPVDLDGDGSMEIVAGSTIYAADGSTRCAIAGADGFPAAADMDGDGLGDVVLVANGTLTVYDDQCNIRMTTTLNGSGIGGPPTLGDLDGDGLPEIGVGNAEHYSAYEADGTVMWSVPVSDWSSSSTGSSFFDFDGDGTLEVVYGDETTLYILDGATGAVRLADDTHSSRTLHEIPVIVDVDGDGMTEIVVPNGGAHTDAEAVGLYVLGSADGSWATNRAVWNQHAYSVTNIDDDLGVPTVPLPNWPTYNSFRSGTIDPVSGGALPDAVPVVDVCNAACDEGRLVVHVAVGNQGMSGLRAHLPVTLYVDGVAVETAYTGGVIQSAGVSEAITFEVAPGATVRVAVDDEGDGDGRVVECNEDNNAGEEEGCPGM
jgi:hypothetical protein